LGPQTKSSIYDFEENNPYFVSQSEIQSSLVKSVEISSDPTPIQTISSSSQLNAEQLSGDNSIHLSTKIIVSEDKIKSIPGTSIAEVLEYVLGINIKRQGASDVLANISTFGGTGEQTLILVDGLKISNQQTLHHDLDLPINIDDIKQIEVYRNAAARAYGTGAISGVVPYALAAAFR
jgi:outer membrane cobalamin receptor